MGNAAMRTVLCYVVLVFCAASVNAQQQPPGIPGAETNIEIIFRVNMNTQIGLGRFNPDIDFPVVRGTINGWGCSDAMLETDDEEGVYELRVQVINHVIGAGEYKFNINCGEGGLGRWEDAISNRSYTVTGAEPDENGDGFGELLLDTVFFDDAVGGADAELFFQVDMNVQIASGRFNPLSDRVFVRGALNGWSCSEALGDEDEDGVYELYLQVFGHQAGAGQFKFNINCADDGWEDSIANRRYNFTGNEPDTNGDGFLEVEVPVVFFDNIRSGPDVEIHFQVDMTAAIAQEVFIPENMTVHVGGVFNRWNCSVELEEFDENVFELEVRIPSHPVGVGEYKFNISCDEFSWEAEIVNRTYRVTSDLPDTDGDGFLELVPAVAFYNALANPFLDAELVFQVDMSVLEDAGLFDSANETVVVRGEFNGWDCTEAMSRLGDGIYEVSVEAPGLSVGRGEYKFNIGCEDVGWEDAIPNRQYFVLGDEVDSDGDGLAEVRVGPVYFDNREPAAGLGPFVRGDCGQAGNMDISSGIFLLGFLFSGGSDPGCMAACDADGDGRLDITTAVFIFNFLFLGGVPPSAPFPGCGLSESAGDLELGCAESTGCG